jgi:hypothetical protein
MYARLYEYGYTLGARGCLNLYLNTGYCHCDLAEPDTYPLPRVNSEAVHAFRGLPAVSYKKLAPQGAPGSSTSRHFQGWTHPRDDGADLITLGTTCME